MKTAVAAPVETTAPWLEDQTQKLRLSKLFSFSWADVYPIGLSIHSRSFSWEDYEGSVNTLITFENASQWAIGDAYNMGVIRFGDRDPSQVFTSRNVRYKTMQNYAWVCNRFVFQQRMFPPSFSHHSVVAKLEPKRRAYWLQRTIEEDLSCEELEGLTFDERGVVSPPFDPFSALVEQYNRSLKLWQQLPNWPEKRTIERALKLIEGAIHKIEERLANHQRS